MTTETMMRMLPALRYATPLSGNRGLFGGGADVSNPINSIDKITITSPANSTSFGDLTAARTQLGCTSNGTDDRGVWAGGAGDNVIDYVTVSSDSNAISFGELSVDAWQFAASGACSNRENDRGIFGAGIATGPNYNYIHYITLTSLGDSTSFGELSGAWAIYATATDSGVNDRGIFTGGQDGGNVNIIEFITITSTGDSSDFGDLTEAKRWADATSNASNNRGVIIGGVNGGLVNVLEYISINSLSNGQDFGDLSETNYGAASVSNATGNIGVISGSASKTNNMDYITITNLSNSISFGDLTGAYGYQGGCSN